LAEWTPAGNRRRNSTGDSFREFALSTALAFLHRGIFDDDGPSESFVITRSGGSQNRRGAFTCEHSKLLPSRGMRAWTDDCSGSRLWQCRWSSEPDGRESDAGSESSLAARRDDQ